MFTLHTKSQFNSFAFTFSSRPSMTVATPKAAVFDGLVLCVRMDALVLFNRRAAEASPETLCDVLLYTIGLNLRAVFQVADVQDVTVSLHGVIVIATRAIYKYDFCGNLVKKVELNSCMWAKRREMRDSSCSAMSRSRDILLCGREDD